MREIKELKFEELTTKQKLGIIHTPLMCSYTTDEVANYICDRVRERAIGCVWIQWSDNPTERPRIEQFMKMVREAADYPIIIITDAESGLCDYKVGQHNAVGCTGSEAHAYAFGKTVGVTLRKLGYNMVCNPVLDIKSNGWTRSYGSDKYQIAKLAGAEARGLHDAGILTLGKHYPSAKYNKEVDTHMAEARSDQTEEELLDYSLYAYVELVKQNLLDGLMPGHEKMLSIDPTAPTSLSKPVLDVIRRQGFDGIFMTDALCMMGIRARYGRVESQGLAIAAGNDIPLVYDHDPAFNQQALYDCYDRGVFSDEDLDRAVKNILAAQHKVFKNMSVDTEITEEEHTLSKNINYDGITAIFDDGIDLALPRDGKYFFALMIRNESVLGENKLALDTFTNGWHYPEKITAKIKELFPNSHVEHYFEYPVQGQHGRIFTRSLDYDKVIFLTHTECLAYMGKEHLTRRVECLIEAMQDTDRIHALIHFGNVKVLENLPHIPRVILGGVSTDSTMGCLEVLAGLREPKGVLTFYLNLK